MKTIEVFDEMPFVNEECGDTMWNEENLNPPKSNDNKSPLSEDSIIKIVRNSSVANGK